MNIKAMRIKISRFSAEKIKRRGWFLIILGRQDKIYYIQKDYSKEFIFETFIKSLSKTLVTFEVVNFLYFQAVQILYF